MEEDASLSSRTSVMSSVLDSLNLRCLMTSHIQGRSPFFSMSEVPGTPVTGDGITSTQ